MTTLRETAFNTFFDYHVDTLKLESNEFVQGYKKNLKEIADKYGKIDWQDVDSEQTNAILSDVGRNAIGFGLEKIGDTIKTSLGLAGAGVASGDPLQGGVVALAGGLFDLAFDGLADWLEVDPNVELRPGEWCILDEVTGFRRRLQGGLDQLDPLELEELAGETPRSPAANGRLCLNIRTDGVEREVLDVESGNTRFVPRQMVRRVDSAHQRTLNGNKVLHAIKEYVEERNERPVLSYDQLDLPVNNRVGDTVNYQGQQWVIAAKDKSREGTVTITSNGQYREVKWEELGPASNQTSARPLDDGMGSFVSDAQGVSVGEWVYVDYDGEYHLGVAQRVDGIDVLVVSGDRRDDPKWEKADNLEKWNHQPAKDQLGRFRDAVIRRNRPDLITQYRPDVDYSSVVFVRERKAASYFQSKVTSSFAKPKPSDPLYGKVASVPVADKVYEAEAYQETGALRMRGGGDTYDDYPVDPHEPTTAEDYGRATGFYSRKTDEKESNSQTMYLIGAACLAGVLIYVYR